MPTCPKTSFHPLLPHHHTLHCCFPTWVPWEDTGKRSSCPRKKTISGHPRGGRKQDKSHTNAHSLHQFGKGRLWVGSQDIGLDMHITVWGHRMVSRDGSKRA